MRELIAISEGAGLPGEVFHLKVAHRPSWGLLMDSVRPVVEAARARGVDVAADMDVYTAAGTGLEATIPSWAFEGGNDSLRTRLTNPEIRARLKREQQTGSPGWWNIVEAAGGWDGIVLANVRNNYRPGGVRGRPTGRERRVISWLTGGAEVPAVAAGTRWSKSIM